MKSNNIAESGVLVALTLLVLFSTSILSISTLSIMTVASCLIPIAIIRTSVKNAILVYIASSILSFMLVPPNIAIYYTLFFGIYGIIKYFIEKFKSIPLEILIKLISFNILLGITYLITKTFLSFIYPSVSLWFLWIASQVVFLIYDYALTLAISFFLNRFKRFS
jgi:hypothetical protein